MSIIRLMYIKRKVEMYRSENYWASEPGWI